MTIVAQAIGSLLPKHRVLRRELGREQGLPGSFGPERIDNTAIKRFCSVEGPMLYTST